MSLPLVSIIIPCYNAGAWLPDAVESALAQTWPRKEIIVVNDGSGDDSLAVARRYEARGVRVIDQPNRGASAARNAGLGTARGEYVQFLDADDILALGKVDAQMRLFTLRGRENVLVSGGWARFQRDPREADFVPQANWRDMTGVEFLQMHFETGAMMQPAAWLSPRALLDRAGPWDESLSLNDDGEYFARVMLAAERIVFCADARSYYRSGLTNSLSGRSDRRALESLYRSVDLTLGYLNSSDTSPRTIAASAHGWKWIAFEMYPGAPDLARAAERNSVMLGGSRRPFPAGGRFQLASMFLGWRLAKRLFC